MKTPPVRIMAWILLPISLFLLWNAPSYFIESKVDEKNITWPKLREELHGDRWNKNKVPFDLDSSIFCWRYVQDTLRIHILHKDNAKSAFVFRTSIGDFWVCSDFKPMYNEERKVYETLPYGLVISKVYKKNKTIIDALVIIANSIGFDEIYKPLNKMIENHHELITKKLWEKEFFIFNSLASFLLILMGFTVVSFTLKDIAMLGYTPKMKMLHWWHYFFFLPKTAPKMKKHFNQEKDRLIEQKRTQLFDNFREGVKFPNKIYRPKLKDILYSQGETEAKRYCLKRIKAWDFTHAEARKFLLNNFYDFFKYSSDKRNTIVENLTKIVSFENISLKALSQREEITNVTRVFHQKDSTKMDDRTIFLEKLSKALHWQYYEYEELITSLHHNESLINCFDSDIDQTYKNLQLYRAKHLLKELHVNDTKKYLHNIEEFEINDLMFSISVLFKLKELRLKWENRDQYLTFLISKEWDNLNKLFETKRTWLERSIDSVFPPIQENHKKTNSIKDMKFLIISDYLSDKQENQLSEVFEKYGANIVVLHGTTRSRPRVDYVILLTSLMSHGTGSFYKHLRNRLYIPFMNGERIVQYLQSMI